MTHRHRLLGYWLSYACWLWLVFGVYSVNAMQAFNTDGFRLCTSAGVVWLADGTETKATSQGLEHCLAGAEALPTNIYSTVQANSGHTVLLTELTQGHNLAVVKLPQARAPPIL